jgi:hypothetical protein
MEKMQKVKNPLAAFTTWGVILCFGYFTRKFLIGNNSNGLICVSKWEKRRCQLGKVFPIAALYESDHTNFHFYILFCVFEEIGHET